MTTYTTMTNSDILFLLDVAMDHENWPYYATLQEEADKRGI